MDGSFGNQLNVTTRRAITDTALPFSTFLYCPQIARLVGHDQDFAPREFIGLPSLNCSIRSRFLFGAPLLGRVGNSIADLLRTPAQLDLLFSGASQRKPDAQQPPSRRACNQMRICAGNLSLRLAPDCSARQTTARSKKRFENASRISLHSLSPITNHQPNFAISQHRLPVPLHKTCFMGL